MPSSDFKFFISVKWFVFFLFVFIYSATCLQSDDISVTQENDKNTQIMEAEEVSSSKNVLSSADSSKEDLRDDYLNPTSMTAMNNNEMNEFD